MLKFATDRESDRIDLSVPEHVEYWTKEFGITSETLRMLIEHHGPRASELRLVIGK